MKFSIFQYHIMRWSTQTWFLASRDRPPWIFREPAVLRPNPTKHQNDPENKHDWQTQLQLVTNVELQYPISVMVRERVLRSSARRTIPCSSSTSDSHKPAQATGESLWLFDLSSISCKRVMSSHFSMLSYSFNSDMTSFADIVGSMQ